MDYGLQLVRERCSTHRKSGLKVPCAAAVSVGMDTKQPTPKASRDLIRAAGETLELICRLRGVDIEDLSDDELTEFFSNALGDDIIGPW